MSESIGVTGAKVSLVSDEEYPDVARSVMQAAKRYCLCTVFIVDADPGEDNGLAVDELLREMASARWRGVDARLIIGGSEGTWSIRNACLSSRARAQELGVPARLMAGASETSVHTKLVVSDDFSLLGSHNWSPGAFGEQTQDSVLLEKPELAAWFVSRFEEYWSIAGEEGYGVFY